MFKNFLIPCHKQGEAIKVVENKIMIICQCLTEQDIKQVILFHNIAERSENV